MDLYILLDVSGSMSNIIDDDRFGKKRKIDIVREYLVGFLSEAEWNNCSAVRLYSFSTSLSHIASFSMDERIYDSEGQNTSSLNYAKERKHILDAVAKIKLFDFKCSGGTKIWDNLYSLITSVPPETSAKILVVTDGEDSDSKYTYSLIANEIKSKPKLELLILDIEGSLNRIKEKGDKFIITVKKPHDIKKILRENIKMDFPKHSAKGLDISIFVIPVIPCSDKDLSLVRSAVQEAVPYLEELTGLRYYPVPTYIVDEYTIKSYIEEPFQKSKDKELIKRDIIEFLRFYQAVTHAINQWAFYPFVKAPHQHEYWGRYFKWSENSKDIVFSCCEGSLGVFDFVEIGQFGFKQVYELPELLSYKDDISKFEAVSKELLNYLRERKAIHGENAEISDHCFNYNTFLKYEGELDYPNLQIWQEYLLSDYQKILDCLEKDGSWKKDLTSIIEAFMLALPVLIKLLREWEIVNTNWYKVAKEMHTYGVYLHRSLNNSESKLSKFLRESGFPDQFSQVETGKVLLCLERCKKRIENISHELKERQGIKDLWPRLLKATLIHEHAHAITFEGIGTGCETYYINTVKNSRKYFRAVSETIAEWAELNYFRNSGDKDLYEIIKCHAKAGDFPNWSYRGALLLEDNEQGLPRDLKFRSLIRYFRSNSNSAYRLLKNWR